jgi:hypothetical protein
VDRDLIVPKSGKGEPARASRSRTPFSKWGAGQQQPLANAVSLLQIARFLYAARVLQAEGLL